MGVTGWHRIVGWRSSRKVSSPTIANRLPNTQYRRKAGAPTTNGTNGDAKTLCPI